MSSWNGLATNSRPVAITLAGRLRASEGLRNTPPRSYPLASAARNAGSERSTISSLAVSERRR